MSIKITGSAIKQIDRKSVKYLSLRGAHQRLSQKDCEIWGQAAAPEAAIRLNWVDLPSTSLLLKPEIDLLKLRFANAKRLVLCGMGGSSLAPEVLAKTFQRDIFIVDSTDPHYLAEALTESLSETLFIVSSKSGSTIETASQRSFFTNQLSAAGLDPIEHMLYITDPDSPLDIEVRAAGFAVINADPNVGGRFSALTAFGLVPAALVDIDVWQLLADAARCKADFLANDETIIDITYLLSEVAGQYLGVSDEGSAFPGLSDWLEQLIAESTGKDGQGRLPIVSETGASAGIGGAFTISFSSSSPADLQVESSLGGQFILWEWVTALLGAALEIDPFNQPNVTEAKEATLALLSKWDSGSKFSPPRFNPDATSGQIEIFGTECSVIDSLRKVIAETPSDGYISIMAYLDRRSESALVELREIIARNSGRPTTFGWGPRFLHSTGQFHKAGQPNGSFLQITGGFERDFEIPGRPFTFGTLITAQALGDGNALAKRGYPVTRLNLLNRRVGVGELLIAARAL